jgi:hypothetical protein
VDLGHVANPSNTSVAGVKPKSSLPRMLRLSRRLRHSPSSARRPQGCAGINIGLDQDLDPNHTTMVGIWPSSNRGSRGQWHSSDKDT